MTIHDHPFGARLVALLSAAVVGLACGDDTKAGAGGNGPTTTAATTGEGGASSIASSSSGPTSTCGNGAVEPGEACDDGNTIAGDGCTASCVVSGTETYAGFLPDIGGPFWPRRVAWISDDRLAVVGQRQNADDTGDIVVMVLSASGELIWKDVFDGAGDEGENLGGTSDLASDLVVLSDGTIVVGGYEYLTDPAVVPSPWESAWVRRYDSSGTPMWTKGMPQTTIGRVYAVAAYDNDDLVVGGEDGYRAWGQRYNKNGALLGELALPTPTSCTGCAVTSLMTNGTDRLLMAGNNKGTSGNVETYVSTFDHDGNQLWSNQIASSTANYAYDAGLDSEGNAFVLASGSPSMYLLKYDSAGNLTWRLDDPISMLYVEHFAPEPSGGPIFAGATGDSDPSTAIALARLDGEGGEVWSSPLPLSFAGPYPQVQELATGPNGRVAVIGTAALANDETSYHGYLVVAEE